MLNSIVMNFKPILSILPSITEIIGTLIQADDYDYIGYPLSGQIGMDSIYFFKKGDDIVISNLSDRDKSVCFPRINTCMGHEYIIPAKTNCVITSRLHDYANEGGKYICLSTEQNDSSNPQTATNDTTEGIVNFSGSLDTFIEGSVYMNENVCIDFLPPYLIIEVAPPLTLKGISYLKIYGDGYVPVYAYQNIEAGQSECSSYVLKYENAAGSQYIKIEGSLICGNYMAKKGGLPIYEEDTDISQFLKTGQCLNYGQYNNNNNKSV